MPAGQNDLKPLVVVDTNKLNSEKSYSLLLGNRHELQAIAKVADLLIPAVVIEEAIEHKRHVYDQDVKRVKGSGALRLCGVDVAALPFPSFDDIEFALRNDQSIPFRIIKPRDSAIAFEKLHALAVRHKAPFEDKSDKGFKDGCIAASIDDYLEDEEGATLYLLTEDNRLSSYFSENSRVIPVSSYKELLAQLGPERGEASDVADNSGKSAESRGFPAAVTDPEIISDLKKLTDELGYVGSFSGTHSVIGRLRQLGGTIGRNEGIDLLRAAVRNDQVYEILRDDDVWSFLYPLFKSFGDGLEDSEYGVFVEYGDLPYEREEDPLDVHFTRSEKAVFSQVLNALGDHLSSVGAMASVRTSSEIIEGFRRVLSRNQLNRSIGCKELLAAVIDGRFSFYDGAILTDTLREFLGYYKRAGDVKKEAVINGLVNKIESAETDYTDMSF